MTQGAMQQSLTPEQQRQLAKLCEGMRNLYGTPEFQINSSQGMRQASGQDRLACQQGLGNALSDPVIRALFLSESQSAQPGLPDRRVQVESDSSGSLLARLAKFLGVQKGLARFRRRPRGQRDRQ